MTLLAVIEAAVPAVAFLLMLAVGLDVTRDDLARVGSDRRTLIVATLAQALLLPVTAILLATVLPRDSMHAEYLLLTAASPGGGMSNVYVYIARADTALSVTLTAASCVLAVLTMPLAIAGYEAVMERPMGFALPVPTLLAQLLIMAVIPVAIGAFVRHRRPAFERRHGALLRGLSAAGVIAVVIMGLIQSTGTLDRTLVPAGFAAAGLVAAGMAIGWACGAWLRMDASSRFTLLVEFAVRNLAIAMVIEVTLLGQPDFIAFGALALLAQALLLFAAVLWWRR